MGCLRQVPSSLGTTQGFGSRGEDEEDRRHVDSMN
jgi:hypothetical protein